MNPDLSKPVSGMAQMRWKAGRRVILFFLMVTLSLTSCREKPVEEAVLVISAS